MKQFWKKIPGKVTLFIVHLLCVMFLLGGVVAAYLMADVGVYTETKDEVFNSLSKQIMGADIMKMLQKYNRTTDTPLMVGDCGNLRFYLYEGEDNLVAESKEQPNPDKDLAGATLYYYYDYIDEAPAVEEEAAESSIVFESETVESEAVESETVESETTESSVTEESEAPEASYTDEAGQQYHKNI